MNDQTVQQIVEDWDTTNGYKGMSKHSFRTLGIWHQYDDGAECIIRDNLEAGYLF